MYLSKGSKGYARCRQQDCVCVFARVHVCVCVTPPVTDARLFMCEVWECRVGRWVDTRVFASACVKGRSVCGFVVGGFGAVV